jgi:acetyl esterase
MVLDPQAAAVIEEIEKAGLPPFEEMTVPEAREAALAFIDMQGDPEPVADIANRFILGPHGDIPIRIYTPDVPAPRPAVVYFHGSGWVIANIDVSDKPCRSLANRSGCVVVAVNYRKAPEHKFPQPFDDCWAATQWVVAHADELGVDPSLVAVAGDSAGGNLAAAVTLKAKAAGGPPLAYQVLIYPATNHGFDTPSAIENAEGYLLQRESMRWFWNHYLETEQDGKDPLASPLQAEDLSGLPPAFIATAEYDPLRDEGEQYGERLREAGVPVTMTRYEGQIHGFFWMAGVIDQGKRLIEEIATELRRALSP